MSKFISKSKLLLKYFIGRALLEKVDFEIPSEQFGAGYGAWRVLTETLNRDSIIYSVGVGEDVGFDLGLIRRFGLTIYAFDPTPRSISWVESKKLPMCFRFHKYGLANYDGVAQFLPPENPEHVSHSMLTSEADTDESVELPVKRLETIMKELGHDVIDVLKLDIEGAEYDVIDDMLGSSIRPRQLLVEFHHRFSNIDTVRSETTIRTLRSVGYRLFFVSDSGEEFCFTL